MNDIMFHLEPVFNHIGEHLVFYVIGAIVAAVVIYFTRPYSISYILYGVEGIIYFGLMHAAVHVCVRFAAWFHYETTFRALSDPVAVHWETPLIRFWEWDLYNPQWLRWVELAFVLIIIGLMRRYRPMRVQRSHKINVKAAAPQKKKKADDEDEDDDGWGVSKKREYTIPDDFVKDDKLKKM